MIKNSKVMVVRIEYEREGARRTSYGEIDENKLEGFHAGEEVAQVFFAQTENISFNCFFNFNNFIKTAKKV